MSIKCVAAMSTLMCLGHCVLLTFVDLYIMLFVQTVYSDALGRQTNFYR